MDGTIKKVMAEKGFGFIRGKDGVERFFHHSAVKSAGGIDALREGQAVTFEHADGNKGPRAADVRQA
jgi:CspA family cold shock protein